MAALRFILPLLLAASSQAAWPACSADSGGRRLHLLELYTSEGCSSCPPADRYLSGLRNEANVVPLAFHVDYWNHLGWPDRFAKPEYSRRQRDGAAANDSRFVYTPQFVLDGRDWRRGGSNPPWRTEARGQRLNLDLTWRKGRLGAQGTWAGAAGQAYLALYENALESAVAAGENQGRKLRHDFVVRQLAGPLAIAAGRFQTEFVVDPAWQRPNLGVAAFVVAPDGVAQALRLSACPSSR